MSAPPNRSSTRRKSSAIVAPAVQTADARRRRSSAMQLIAAKKRHESAKSDSGLQARRRRSNTAIHASAVRRRSVGDIRGIAVEAAKPRLKLRQPVALNGALESVLESDDDSYDGQPHHRYTRRARSGTLQGSDLDAIKKLQEEYGMYSNTT